MSVTPQVTYPGVYIQEVPSGVRTIVGVATSITAFAGRASRGPVNKAVTINSYADFERNFGGLWIGSTLGYAVRDFFMNGGSQAIIVRLYHEDKTQGAKPSKTRLSVGGCKLVGANEGAWGSNLRATVDIDVSKDKAESMGLQKADLFNVTVRDVGSGAIEQFLNLSFKDSPRRVDKVLEAESDLVRWEGAWPPAPLPTPKAEDDSVTKAEKDLTAAATPADITAAQTKVANAKKALETSDGLALTEADDFTPANAEIDKKGLYALEQADLFNMLCIPPYLDSGDVDVGLVSDAAVYCQKRRAMLLVDPPSNWKDKTTAKSKFTDATQDNVGTRSRNAALFYPRIRQPNPLRENQVEEFVPCGAVAGIFARTDAERGVWKAPAGLDAIFANVPELSIVLTDAENGELNPLGINCLRTFPVVGRVVWGARTLRGADQLADEYKYIPVRRVALYIEESLYRGTKWVVFEPNDEPLWSQIRLNVGAFMHTLFRQGAFQGKTPQEAYFVKCDKETTTQDDINRGIVNILVGFAPLKPAEFVVIKISQIAGQIQT